MEVTRSGRAEAPLVTATGTLDSRWAEHLEAALDEALRDGARQVELDLSGISFMSSAGIRVLLGVHHRLEEVGGRLAVRNPSPAVQKILGLVGLLDVLVPAEAVSAPAAAPAGGRTVATSCASFELFDLAPGATLRCRPLGVPAKVAAGEAVEAGEVAALDLPQDSFAVGVGAFGADFAACRGRFGEFVAAGGCAAFLPTDGSNTPDYMAAAGSLVPQVQAVHALVGSGAFRTLALFEGTQGAVGLGDLLRFGLEQCGAPLLGFVMVAECAGLVGAALRRSPAEPRGALFAFPDVREQLLFTPERTFARGQAVIAGFAASAEDPRLAPWMRPLDAGGLLGHVHAAAFTHRLLPRGRVEPAAVVHALFDSGGLLGVLHLLSDGRRLGAGQSELRRGAFWMGPATEVAPA